jgi:DNA-binding beta-propeller fold protein YncE
MSMMSSGAKKRCREESPVEDSVVLGSLKQTKEAKVEITLLLEQADAQSVVPLLLAGAGSVLGDGTEGNGDHQLNEPLGLAFVPAHPEWLVITELGGHRVKISNIRTGALVCKFGNHGSGKGQFGSPWGVAVTWDSSFVIVVDQDNHRVQVLQLTVGIDRSSAHLNFVRYIGNGHGKAEGELRYPLGVALLPSAQGQEETVLVADSSNQRVSQFALDGAFIRIFAGTGTKGSGDGEFYNPYDITVLASSGEVAVADRKNHRVQVFDSEGNYKRQFGSVGKSDGGLDDRGYDRGYPLDDPLGYRLDDSLGYRLDDPLAIASDAHGNLLVLDDTTRLQVFSSMGKHICTRDDLGESTASSVYCR